jgi:hypothetical protein
MMALMNVFKTPSKAILYASGFDETILVLVGQADGDPQKMANDETMRGFKWRRKRRWLKLQGSRCST